MRILKSINKFNDYCSDIYIDFSCVFYLNNTFLLFLSASIFHHLLLLLLLIIIIIIIIIPQSFDWLAAFHLELLQSILNCSITAICCFSGEHEKGRHSWIGHTMRHSVFVVNILEGAMSGKKAVGRPRLRYLKQVRI